MPYNFLRSHYEDDSAPIDGSIGGGMQVGDMLYATSNGVASLVSSANSASFVGIATAVPGPVPKPVAAYKRDGLFLLKRTAAQAYALGAKVYVGADAQTVTPVVAGTSIGIVALDQSGNTLDSAYNSAPVYVVIAITPAL